MIIFISLKGLLGLIPGMGKFKAQIDAAKIDDKVFKRQEAIILSMTPRERRNPDIIKASRKKRIADGCGLTVQEVNKLLKQYDQMADMMKKVKKMGKRGFPVGKTSLFTAIQSKSSKSNHRPRWR